MTRVGIYTKTPIRMLTVLGIGRAAASVLGGIACLVLHLLHVWLHGLWLIPVIAFFSSLNLIAVGILGEYVLTLRSKIIRRPLVIEQERINFPVNDGVHTES